MRILIAGSILMLAACGGGEAEKNTAADTTNLALAPGQWETVIELGEVASQDNGTPVMKQGERMTASACIAEGEGKKPAPAIMAGIGDGECSYDNIYMSRGKLNATLSCTRPGLNGKVMISSSGTYTADSFQSEGDVQTYLSSDGDVRAAAKISGRRTGECTAAPAAAAA